MLVIGMAVLFAGYTVGSYGWVLLRGWDITFRQWVSPLHPYTWPAGGADPPPIPPSQLFPGAKSAAGGSGTAGGAQPGRATQPAPGASGAPGTVPVRSQ